MQLNPRLPEHRTDIVGVTGILKGVFIIEFRIYKENLQNLNNENLLKFTIR